MEGLRPGWTMKVIIVIIFTSILFRCVSATAHLVGGQSAGWDLHSNLQAWSASTTFYVGDVLVFSYGPMHDVLEVNQFDFATCRTINPISTHRDGETVVPLTQAGTRYFICGRRGHCASGLRLRLQVVPHSPPPPPPANASTADGSSSSPSNGTHPGPGGDGGGNRRTPRWPPPRRSPPPDSTTPPPPPLPLPLHRQYPPSNGNEEPSPDITLPHPAEKQAPPCSGVGNIMMAGLAYNWWLPFTTLVIIS